MNFQLINNFSRSWKTHATIQAATLTVLTGVFSIITLFLSVHHNLDSILTQWGEEIQMTIFLNDESKNKSFAEVESHIKDNDMVKSYKFVSKEAAVVGFLKQMGSFAPDLLEDEAFENPLPASYELQLSDTAIKGSSFDLLVEFAEKLKTLVEVDDVSYGQGWVENYSSLVTQFSANSWSIIFVLMLGSFLIIGNSIRTSINSRRQDIEVLELVGATRNYIRVPFIVEGALMGLCSSLMALIICYFLFQWQAGIFTSELKFLGLAGKLSFLSSITLFVFPVLGALVGALGSFLCVYKLSTGWSAAERIAQWSE